MIKENHIKHPDIIYQIKKKLKHIIITEEL